MPLFQLLQLVIDEKFCAYAKCMPSLIGNPLYHWTHLELQRVFGIYDILNEDTAEDIWNRANELLAKEEYRARGLVEKFGVKLVCTTDDPIDDLQAHKEIAKHREVHHDSENPKIYP